MSENEDSSPLMIKPSVLVAETVSQCSVASDTTISQWSQSTFDQTNEPQCISETPPPPNTPNASTKEDDIVNEESQMDYDASLVFVPPPPPANK
jgi:hypothetical protein